MSSTLHTLSLGVAFTLASTTQPFTLNGVGFPENILWTKKAANSVVGTKSRLTPNDAQPNFDVSGDSVKAGPDPLQSALVSVTLYQKQYLHFF